MDALAEHHLVESARRGDRAALGELLEHYQHRLYHVVLHTVRQRDDAAEITQQAMLKIIEHIGQFQGRSSIGTWMIRIAMNLSISHLRSRRHRQAASLDGGPDSGASGGGMAGDPLGRHLADAREPGPLHSVEQEEMIQHLHAALGRLDADFRSVIVLRDLNQMDYQQIADVLDIPTGTVKSRLFRARLALRQQMHQLYPPGSGAGISSGAAGSAGNGTAALGGAAHG